MGLKGDMKIVADGNIPFVKECFSSIGDVQVVAGREITPAVVAEADILLVRSVTKVNDAFLTGSNVKFVATATIGFDHIDTDYLAKQGIGFASAPGSNSNSVAEYVVAAMLEVAASRRIELAGKSIGIIGAGNVGSKVATKAAALGMNVLLNDPPLHRQTGDAKYLPIERIFDCDFVTLHTPLTFEGIDKTFHLADERFFASLKKGSIFINTARGAVTDTQALKKAIKSEQVAAAVLDVWENEPNVDCELVEMVDIATPHIAGYSYDGKIGGMIMIYKAACDYFELKAKYDAKAFLPAPAVPEIKIDSQSIAAQEIVRTAVQKIYDIRQDDAALRGILRQPQDCKGRYFDNLRKNYPVRREFQNTKVFINRQNSGLRRKLKGVGFLLVQE